MKQNYDYIIEAMLASEGGYVDHPKDPGGATKYGITRINLAKWRGKTLETLPKTEVKNLTLDEAKAIYKAWYWDKVRGDDLPSGVDYSVFDFGVNSGPDRAVKYLQALLGVAADGDIGPNTLNALDKVKDLKTLINRYNDDRLSFLQGLDTFPTFGKGWTSRVVKVRSGSLQLVDKAGEVRDEPTKSGNGWAALIPLLGTLLTALIGWFASRK